MLPLGQVKTSDPKCGVVDHVMMQMDRAGVNQLPVDQRRPVVGMLSREDLITFLGTLRNRTDVAATGRLVSQRPAAGE